MATFEQWKTAVHRGTTGTLFQRDLTLLDLTLEEGIPGDVMWSIIDAKHIVSVSRHDGFLVDRVNDNIDKGLKRHRLPIVELSQRTQAAVQIVSNLPAPSNGGPIYRGLGMPTMRTRWMAGAAAHKSG